jgi:hypothetical protein
MTSAQSDTQILESVIQSLRDTVLYNRPISPLSASALLSSIDLLRYPPQPAPGEEAHAQQLRAQRSTQRIENPDYKDPAWMEKVAAELLNKGFDKYTNGTSFSDATVHEVLRAPTITVCSLCGSTAMDAPGIGKYCPNVNCDNADGPMKEIKRPTQQDLDAWWDSRFTRGRVNERREGDNACRPQTS